jgi:hypothetical protein
VTLPPSTSILIRSASVSTLRTSVSSIRRLMSDRFGSPELDRDQVRDPAYAGEPAHRALSLPPLEMPLHLIDAVRGRLGGNGVDEARAAVARTASGLVRWLRRPERPLLRDALPTPLRPAGAQRVVGLVVAR